MNPYATHQMLSIVASGACLIAMAYHFWAIRYSTQDLVAAFRLRWLSIVSAILPLLLMGFLLLSFWFGSRSMVTGQTEMVLACILPLISAAFAVYLGKQYPTAVQRSLKLAVRGESFDKVQISEWYAQSHPDDVESLLPLFEETVTMRLAAKLVAKGVRVKGRPLEEVIADRLESKGDHALIEHALKLHVFRHKPELEKRMQNLIRDAGMLAWDAILSQADDAPRVGHALGRILEDAITFQTPIIKLELKNPKKLDRASNLALNEVAKALQEHFARVHIKLDISNVVSFSTQNDTTLHSKTLPWTIVLDPLDVQNEKLEWAEYILAKTSQLSDRSTPLFSNIDNDNHRTSTRKVQHTSEYAMLKLRCTVSRDGRQVTEIEANSGPGLGIVKRHDSMKKGLKPPQIAAHMLMRSIVQSGGLRIIGEGNNPDLGAWPGFSATLHAIRNKPEHTAPTVQNNMDTSVALSDLVEYADGEHGREELAEALEEVEAALAVQK